MGFIFGSGTGVCSAPYWGKGRSRLPGELFAVLSIPLEPGRG